jgi:predicted nucleotidyltransferase
MGLIIRTPQGNQVLYRANPQSPVFTEIKSLIAKTVGVHDALRFALRSLTDQIQFAFVYGSVASQTEKADSDIDLMVLGHVSFHDVVAVLSSAQRIVNREINPTVFSIPEFQSKYASGNHFLRSIMKGPKLFVIGSEHDLTKLVAK